MSQLFLLIWCCFLHKFQGFCLFLTAMHCRMLVRIRLSRCTINVGVHQQIMNRENAIHTHKHLCFYWVHKLCIIKQVWKAELQRREIGETQREVFHLLVRYSNSQKGWSWADPKLGLRCFLISHMVAETKGLEPAYVAFQVISRGLIRSGSDGTWMGTYMGCQHHRQTFKVPFHGTCPTSFIFKQHKDK